VSATITLPTNLPKSLLTAALALGTTKLMLATATFTPNQDTLDFINDVTNEATGTSYSAGGITMTSVVTNVDTATNTVTLDAADVTPAGLSVSCRWGFIYISTGTPSTSPVLAIIDFTGGVGGNVTLTFVNWDAAGIVPFVVPA
jgi:hypothetical protein